MTHGAAGLFLIQSFLNSVEGEGDSIELSVNCWVPQCYENLLWLLKEGVPPLPCIYFLSQTSQNHKNQRWLQKSQPSNSENPARGVHGRATRDVSLLLLTQVCLPGSLFPISLPQNFCSPQIYALGRLGIYGVFITHPTRDPAPLPAAVKTTHSHPAEHQAVDWGKLLGNNAQLWPKSFAQLPKRWW